MRAENQRVPSEIAGVEHGEAGDDQGDADDAAACRRRRAIRLMMSPASSGVITPITRRADDQREEERQVTPVGPGDAEDPAHRALGQRAAGDRRVAAERPHRRHGGHGMTHVHRLLLSGCGTTVPRPANAARGRAVPGGTRSAPPTSSCSRSTWAARSAASWSRRRCGRRSAPAPPSPGWPRTGGAAARRPGRRRRRRARRPGRRGWPARSLRLGRPHRPAGQADLQRPGVADQLDQRAGAGQVGHQAQRGLGQPQLGVVGEDPQVAGERELAAGADRVPLHGGDRDDARASAASGSRPGTRGCGPRPPPACAGRGRPGRRRPRLGAEQAAVQAGGERAALAAHDDDPDVVVQRRADRRRAPARWPASGR